MSSPLVLLVEDHADTLDMYATVLAASGFAVAEAQDATTALAVAREQLPSIVVTDVRMAGDITARSLCEHFRKQEVPVIAVTGVTPGAEQDELRDAGCTELFVKPFSPLDLVEAIQRVLRAQPVHHGARVPH